MSMEYYAFVPRDALPTRAEWQDAIARLDFPILLDPGFDPKAARGFCRMSVEGKNAGCEIDADLDNVAELAEAYPALDGKALDGAAIISFRFGSDMLAGDARSQRRRPLCSTTVPSSTIRRRMPSSRRQGSWFQPHASSSASNKATAGSYASRAAAISVLPKSLPLNSSLAPCARAQA